MAILPGISMITPKDKVTKVGVPQPIFIIGPIKNLPSSGGKIARKSLIMRGALAIISPLGNIILLTVPVRTPCAKASSRMVRFSPIRPPKPTIVNPKPS